MFVSAKDSLVLLDIGFDNRVVNAKDNAKDKFARTAANATAMSMQSATRVSRR